MGIFSAKADTQVYSTGEDTRAQNSRVVRLVCSQPRRNRLPRLTSLPSPSFLAYVQYLLTLIAYLGIFLFGYDTGQFSLGSSSLSLCCDQRDGCTRPRPNARADHVETLSIAPPSTGVAGGIVNTKVSVIHKLPRPYRRSSR